MRVRVLLHIAIVVALGWAVTSTNAQVRVAVKQVAAPAPDILSGLVRLPDPASLAVNSRSLMLPVDLVARDGVWVWDRTVAVPEGSGARVAFLPEADGFWETELRPPEAAAAQPGRGVREQWGTLPWGDPDRPFLCLQSPDGQPGNWAVGIRSVQRVDGFVLIDSGSGVELSTSQGSLSTLSGVPITLRSSFSDGYRVRGITADIVGPNGVMRTKRAVDWADELSFRPANPGRYSVRLVVSGQDDSGREITLSTQHLIRVESPAAGLGKLSTRVDPGTGIEFRFADDPSGRRTILAAEVWGRAEGVMEPVCWLSRVCGEDRSLTLDPRWIAMTGVDPSTLELRELRLHDVDSMVPIARVDRVVVGGLSIKVEPVSGEPTPEMLRGSMPQMVTSPVNQSTNRAVLPGHRLMLVHGYCTDANPFPVGQFSGDLAVFEDFEQSRSHDAFALEMLAQGAPMKSFGVVGHSQGGMGALHLYTFYWSGMDWAKGGRLIQSVGAPYQGTALAGNAAVLGDLFGFGCGENDSMTYTGSAAWLSTIPSWARADVWYWTTSFEDRAFLFDYCNIVTDLLLSDPDDGVIERSAGQLPGANNMGHTEGWCHTTGMRDPAQCTDSARNAQMNTEASR